MHDEYCNCCPPPDWEKNRFQPENRFVGDIEDGRRYPFDVYKKSETYSRDEVYSKAESDEKYATEAEAEDIRTRLSALEYEDIGIVSFTASPSVCELGSSAAISLNWVLNKRATQQNINGTAVSGSSAQFTVTTSANFTLNVTDGHTNASKSTSVSFANQIYYGAAADLNSITELTKVLSNSKAREITVTAGEGEYIIYAIPARLGSVEFYVSGFEGGFEPPVEQLLSNESGYAEMYKVYRSTNANLGETTVEIREG